MPAPFIATADYTPDQPPYTNANAQIVQNLYPKVGGGMGPLQGAVAMSNALSGQCYGAFTARDKAGTAYVVAGTTTGLYLQAALSWTNKSGTTYALPSGNHWRFTQFGEQIIATGYGDNIQTWTMGSVGTNFADLSSGAPKAKYIATIEPGFCMVGFYNTGSATPNGLWWSALNDATSWPTPGTLAATSVQSDNQQIPGGGAVTGILPAIGGAAGVVFTERAIYRVEYVGAPLVFSFREIDRSRGCIAPQSLAQVGAIAYFLSEDGFCSFNGSQVQPLGTGRVDRTFFASVDQTALERVYATVDFDRKLIIWAYPTTGAGSQNPNRWLLYNYASNQWAFGDDAGLSVEYIFPARTAGYTLDSLDAALPGGPDGSGSFTVDSTLYMGGKRVLAGFSTAHKLVSFTGDNLAARYETGDVDANGSRVFVAGITPITDCATPTACVGWRSNISDAVSYTTATAPGYDNRCPQRISGQYARAAVTFPAGAAWTYFQGARVDFTADGER